MTQLALEPRGALPLADGGVRFSVWAPHARELALRVVDGPGSGVHALEAVEDGAFFAHVAEAAAGSDYVFVVDGRELPDPASRHQPHGVDGPSRVVDPKAFRWSDADWRGLAPAELVLYELHVGALTETGTFDAVVSRLDALRELGVTAIELMPIAQFPGRRNWGYDGVFPWAAQNTYGGPEGFARLVDAAHARGLGVVLDVVYNHLGPEGNVLPAFGPYFTSRYETPWGDALNFDGPDSDEVRAFFVCNALYWLRDLHVDGLRLDAVHAIHDESPTPFLADLVDAVRALEAESGRRIWLAAESDANDPGLVRARERGGIGLDAVWCDDFHHALHALLTGECGGYYADYGEIEDLARAFANRFVYDGRRSRFRRRRHGAPAQDVPRDRFVVFAQNHDQVGNRALGERLATLLSPQRLRLAAALSLLAPYVPLLFMGEEYGETRPFLYFVDHAAPALREAVRAGRRAEFASFAWRGEIPDPSDERTFLRSRLDPAQRHAPGHAELYALHAALLAARRAEPALRPGAAQVDVTHDAEQGWLRATYRPPGARPALVAFQLVPAKGSMPVPREGGPWRLCLTSEDAAFGGCGRALPERVAPETAMLTLPPECAALYIGGEN